MIETHIHKKTGNRYELLMVTNKESEKDAFVPTAVYIDENGATWSRPLDEFNNRFDVVE